eukprot:TRINITY_DN3878_c0_g1_i1.p1 TRINITY_DN3878_c0_g1~~TRINITY_DN3878_c0_g1_i1.p1  ORF type:complete len:673 (+),score=199.14 TRINITY_DN3878_c0_g1_i1:75-2021(+)
MPGGDTGPRPPPPWAETYPGAVGIDLGTTFSCVAVFRESGVEVLADESGFRTTPSVVAFTDAGAPLVGRAALAQQWANPERTVYDAKRLIGRKVADPCVAADRELWPFRVEPDEDGFPLVMVPHGGGEHGYRPEFVSSLVLRRMKSIAELRLGAAVTRAVVTVPAYFGDSQRQATRVAGRLAGLEVMRIINEPTAAALAYGLGRDFGRARAVLVFDLGGGTFDVSLLRVDGGVFEVLATAGDTHLGGADFDARLVGLVRRELAAHAPEVAEALVRDKALRGALHTACEAAKRRLSDYESAAVPITAVARGGAELAHTLRRSDLDACCADLFTSLLDPVRQVLADTGLEPEQVDDVVLVGGSSRIPRVRQLVETLFGRAVTQSGVNLDEAVACGAAVQASILADAAEDSAVGCGVADGVVLIDVTPLSLGIHSRGDLMSVVVPRNTPTPCRAQKVYTTDHDNQETVHIRVYEGERPFTTQNNLLGSFRLHGIPPGPRKTPKILVTFAVDQDGVLCVSAEEQGSERREQLVIESDQGRWAPRAVEAALRAAEAYFSHDAQELARCKAVDRVRSDVEEFEAALEAAPTGRRGVAEQLEEARKAIAQGKEWLRCSAHSADAAEAQRQRALVAERCRCLVKQKRRSVLQRLLS